MHHNIASFFRLKGYLMDGLEHTRKTLEIRVRVASPTVRCPRCNAVCRRVHQRHVRRVLHLVVAERQVILLLSKRRFRCRCTPRPFTEVPPGMRAYGRRTQLQRDLLLTDLVQLGFAASGQRNGVSPTTARRDLLAAPLDRGIRWPKRGDLRLGLDGHSFRGHRMCMTVKELRHGRTLAVLPDDKKSTLTAFLAQIPKETQHRITEVCMDMEIGNRYAVERQLPRADVVSDHFHVIQLANRVLDQVRMAIQDPRHPIPRKLWVKNKEHLTAKEFELLVAWGERYPKLFTLWRLKEDLRRMYDQHNKRIAAYRLRKVIQGYQTLESGYARDFSKSLERWRVPILNFFEHRTTNASVESQHQKFKLIQRTSFGFRNIQSYIAKITLACVPLFFLLHHTN